MDAKTHNYQLCYAYDKEDGYTGYLYVPWDLAQTEGGWAFVAGFVSEDV